MNLGNSREQTATEIIIDTQTEIKELIKIALVNINSMFHFQENVNKLVDNRVKSIKNENLRETARRTLKQYANNEYQQMIINLNLGQLPIIVAFQLKELKSDENKVLQKVINDKINVLPKSKVISAYSQLGNSQAKVSYGKSLYGYSELTARFEEQQEMVNNLKQKTKLVICDTHSDCSDRCFKWQGRIYSLDGSSGTTEDGKTFIPLEVAVNDTTFGNHNGLLGYNCRHKLHAYVPGMKAIKVSKQEQQKQQKISVMQRALEREIRNTKDSAIAFKGIDDEKYKLYQTKSKILTKEYNEFCEKNNRVKYYSRLTI